VLLEIMKLKNTTNKEKTKNKMKNPGNQCECVSGNNNSGRSADELVAQKVEKRHQDLIQIERL